MFGFLKGRNRRDNNSPSAYEAAARGTRYTLRGGKFVETDAAFDAWTSQDLEKMKRALDTQTTPVDRHFLLMGIVDQTYKQRNKDSEASTLCASIAELHIEEFPQLKLPLVESLDGILPRVTTFQKYATLLAEQGKFERSIEVCQIALSHGLQDGTKSGFEGRIERIRKKARQTNA